MTNDIRFALRTLVKNPAFTIVAVLTLALGVGANTAMFSVVNGVLLRPLPYPEPDRLVEVWSTSSAEPRSSMAAADFLEFQRDNHTLAAVGGYRDDALAIGTRDGGPVRSQGATVTAGYFDVFSTPAELGRTFNRTADSASGEPLVVLSHQAWVQQFASDPLLVGQRVRINSVPHTVVGIMPARFDYPGGAKAWVLSPKPVPLPPIDVAGNLLENRDVHYFHAVGRLKPGVSAERARDDLAAIAADQARRFPNSNGGRGVAIQPLYDKIVGDVRSALLLLLGAVSVVLLIACANVAGLLLARASGRQRELSLRVALGAGRGRLIRQLVTESLILGAIGGAAGLVLGTWATALLLAVMPDSIPRVDQIGFDGRVAGAAIIVTFICALLFGAAPAIHASRTDASSALREADRTATAGRRRARTRAALVAGEVALTLVLLVVAGLLVNSFVRLQHVNPGFRVDQVTLISLTLPQAKYPDGKHQTAFYERVLERLEHRPEIQSAALLFPNPLSGRNAGGTFTIERQPPRARAERPFTALASVSAGYFRTLGIPLIQGRTFTDRDREPAPAVAIANTSLVRRYFPGQDPIGKRVRFGEGADDDWITIVGVVGDSRNVGLNEPPTPVLYLPYHTFPLAFMSIAVRSTAGAGPLASLIRSEVRQIDSDLPIDRIAALSDVVGASVAEPRFRMFLVSAFASIAIVLAAVGIFGLIKYSVAARTREIGIRVALGAQPRQVVLPVVREGLQLALFGIALGLAGSYAAGRLLSGFLFDVRPTDPLTFVAVAGLLLAVAFLATYIPSRGAARIDPIIALRTE